MPLTNTTMCTTYQCFVVVVNEIVVFERSIVDRLDQKEFRFTAKLLAVCWLEQLHQVDDWRSAAVGGAYTTEATARRDEADKCIVATVVQQRDVTEHL